MTMASFHHIVCILMYRYLVYAGSIFCSMGLTMAQRCVYVVLIYVRVEKFLTSLLLGFAFSSTNLETNFCREGRGEC